MTAALTFTFFGHISDRDHFDLIAYTMKTSLRMWQEPAEYLVEAATTGESIAITEGSRQRLARLAEACEEVGLSYHITVLDEDNVALRRECWLPGVSRPFTVELTPCGEPAYTSEQIEDAIQAAGASHFLGALQRWAHMDRPAKLEIDPALIVELRQDMPPRP